MTETQQVNLWNLPYELIGEPLFDPETSIEFRLFDPRICGELQEAWLVDAVAPAGITPSELQRMIAGKLLRRWTNGAGGEGFLLYTEKQARMAKNLMVTGRYTEAELQHMFASWNDFVAVLSSDEMAYDPIGGDEYETFYQHTREMADFFAEEIARIEDLTYPLPSGDLERQKQEAHKRHAEWLRTRDYLATRRDTDLNTNQRRQWRKALHEIRFSNEWARLSMAQTFEAQIEQGYSIEISFRGWTTTNFRQVEFRDIDWPLTLDRVKDTRNEGKTFPLRTPDFNVTERGLELLTKPSPEAYKAVHEKYQLGVLFTLLEERGAGLWECDLDASGCGVCAECGTPFERTTSSRQYCTPQCRNRAKSRRWRESDPERARMAQAKYYRESYPNS